MTVAHPLFAAGDLTTPVGRTVTDAEAEHAERIVWGWLQGPLGLTDRPDTTPDNVWAWAVELGAIYLTNPTGLAERQLGTSLRKFSSERRLAILGEVGEGTSTSTGRPRGCFPPAQRYPDPAWGC
jgi:hypothetical protein